MSQLKVVTPSGNFLPWSIFDNITNTFSGFIYDLLIELESVTNLRFEVTAQEGWHEAFKEVSMNNFDMGGNAFAITNERLNLVDFSIPIMEFTTIVIAKVPKVNENIFSFLSPFSCEIWFGIMLSFISAAILMSFMLR